MRTKSSKSGKKVRYSDLDIHESKNVLFSSEQFMFQIDKFFAKELDVVIQPIDDEYKMYLEIEMKHAIELEQTINELDDFFLNPTEEDKDANQKVRDKEAQEVLEQPTKENDIFKESIRKSINDYEKILQEKKFNSGKEHKEVEKLVENLKNQLNTYEKKEQ